jgi:hypothetical protein
MTQRPHVLSAATAAFALVAALGFAACDPAQAAPRYLFNQGGYDGGAHVSGWFEGNDDDKDGWILGYELTDFSLSFSGNAVFEAFTFSFADAGGPGNLAYRPGSDHFDTDPYGGLWTLGLTGPLDEGGRLLRYASYSWEAEHTPGMVIDFFSGESTATQEPLRVSAAATVPEPSTLMLISAVLLLGVTCLGTQGMPSKPRKPRNNRRAGA